MYAFEAFLSLVAVLAYVNGVLRGAPALGGRCSSPTLALMVYAHNWALFFCVGTRARDRALRARAAFGRSALVAAGVAVLYLPWVPTLLSQAKHTGAPWSTAAELPRAVHSPPARCSAATRRSSRSCSSAALAAQVVRRTRRGRDRALVLAVLVGCDGPARRGSSSQISPAWTTRYFSVVLGPVVLLAARGRHPRGRLGLVALVAVLFLWWGFGVKDDKENAKQIAAQLAPFVHPGELVVSTHPEQVPVLRYYLGGGLRWATTLGPVADPQVFDWRDAVARLQAAQPRATLDPLLASVPPGQRVRGRRAGLPRLPRLEGQLDAARLADARSSGRRSSSATRACGSSTTS